MNLTDRQKYLATRALEVCDEEDKSEKETIKYIENYAEISREDAADFFKNSDLFSNKP